MSTDPFLWSALGAALERARIAARLSTARTTSDVAALVLGDVRAALGADAAVVAVRGDDRALTVAAEGVPSDVTRALSSLSGGEPFPLVRAYRRGEPLFAETAAAVADALPPLGEDAKALACLPLRTPGGTAGALGFGYRGARRFGPGDRAALDDLSRDVAAALERARLRETERAARTRLEVLAEASALLLENAADLPALLGAVTRLIQQATGDPCYVQVLGEDGGLGSGPATVSHPDLEAQAALEAALRGGAEAPARVAEVVLGRGETLHLTALGRAPFDEVAGAHLRAFAARYPVRGLLVTPLRTRGRPFGLVAVLRHRPAPHTAHDRLLVEGVAARAGLAVAYARLNASHAAARARAERAASRTARLQVVTSRLAGAAGLREVAAVGAALAIEAAGGAAGGIALLRPGRGDLELLRRRGPVGEVAGAVHSRVLEGDGPAQACVRSGRPSYHADQAALAAAHPAPAHELERAPHGALAVLPLRVHGEVAGALLVRFDAARAFDAEERAFLENLADQCSQALARARLWEREHEWARRQSALAEISRALSEAHGDVRRLLGAVALRVGSELDALCCVVALAQGPGQPELRAVHHPDMDLRAAVESALELDGSPWLAAPPASALPGREAQANELDPAAWPAGPALRGLLEDHPPRGLAVAPLTIDGRVQGLLSASRHGDAPGLGGADRWFVEEVAARTAVALAQTREREALAAERQRLAEVLARAEEAIRAKDEFLAMLSHELRNPLAPIVTALELLRLRADGGATREREVIERQVSHLVRLVDDLLDVSRMTRGKVRLELQVVDAAEVVARAVEQASPLLEERRHVLTVEVAPGLALHADPSRVAQVVANFLTNAAKYTDPGGRIALRVARDGDMVRIAVTDDGIGLSPALVPRIFDLFVQGERELDRAPGGLGIGLTIVRTMVELHGGRVRAESEGAGRGSTFTAWLPLAAEAELAARPPAPAPAQARAGVRVLVVDDNEDAAELLAEALRARGHEPHVAFDGPSALALAGRIRPRVGLLDLGLPVMDGYELARRLRGLQGPGDLALVAVTGYGQDVDRRASALAGFAEHLVKPVDLDRVCAAVDRLIGEA